MTGMSESVIGLFIQEAREWNPSQQGREMPFTLPQTSSTTLPWLLFSYFSKQTHSQRSDSLSMGGFLQILGKHWDECQKRARGRTLVRCVQGPEYSPQDFKYSSVFQSYMKCTLETQTGCSLHVGFQDTSKSSVSISALKDTEATCLGWG